jgi:ABC-type multidrug transport system fused ATPase/permease subunit
MSTFVASIVLGFVRGWQVLRHFKHTQAHTLCIQAISLIVQPLISLDLPLSCSSIGPNWPPQLTLVILAVTPLLAIAGGIMTTMLQKVSQKGSDAYAKAGEVSILTITLAHMKHLRFSSRQIESISFAHSQVADEVLTSLKTVSAMNGEAKERKRYDAVIQVLIIAFFRACFY